MQVSSSLPAEQPPLALTNESRATAALQATRATRARNMASTTLASQQQQHGTTTAHNRRRALTPSSAWPALLSIPPGMGG